jgi:hypothetical protein
MSYVISGTYNISEFLDDRLALAGAMFLIGFFGIISGRVFNNRTKGWRAINQKYEHLRKKQISNMRFDGEIYISISKKTSVAFLAMFWSLSTLKSVKDHLYDNAMDIFMVFYIAQICGLILIIPHNDKEHGWKEVLTGHLPTIEIALVVVFTYVIWRMGLYWREVSELIDPSVLEKLNNEMR